MLTACNQEVPFLTHETGLRYRYIKEGDGAGVKKGDILVLHMKYKDDKDSLLFNSYELKQQFRTQLQDPSHEGGCIEDALVMLKMGDSLEFKINARLYFEETRRMDVPKGINPEGDITFNLILKGIQTYSQIETERKALKHYNAEEEDKLLTHYLEITNTETEPGSSGLYYVEIEKGGGKKAEAGKTVVLNYTGKLIDGSIFDSSYDRGKPFSFVLGIGDVITGMEEGVAKMHEGGKARLIIPSHIAYGTNGYSILDQNNRRKEIIAPYSTLIFDIELITVQ